MKTPSVITAAIMIADITDGMIPLPVITKREITVIIDGKRPLHGTKLFVSIASRRSRGESIIRHPTTPAALHPSPMHIVSACLPQA